MEPDKNKSPAEGEAKDPAQKEQAAPADALSRTPEELEEEAKANGVDPNAAATAEEEAAKKVSPIKKLFRKVNLYLLIFVLLVVVVGIITIVNYLNSQKAPEVPDIANQQLTQDALKQLANSDATVGNAAQTLTIQGNAIVSGQTLMRGNLNVAGNLQTGGSIQGPNLTISGTSNLGTAQINSLQVAQNTAIQGTTTMRDLNVAGTSVFSGPVTVSQITASRLIMSGNAVLQIPNHIAFTGAPPSRTMTASVVGNGGTVSVNGSDTNGSINISTGNNPTAGCFARINFAQAFTSQPHVIVSPVNIGAGQTDYYVERSTTGFNICTVTAAPANKVFAFDYWVTG